MHRRTFLQAGSGCLAHLLLQAACAPRAQRAAWTRGPGAAGAIVAETPFARLEAIGPGAWAVISTPLGGDRTTFANGGLIAGRTGVVAIEGFYQPAGAAWLAGLARQLTGRHPTHVVVTHYHIDHAAGIAGYAPVPGDASRDDRRDAPHDRAPRVISSARTQDAVLRGGPVAPPRDADLLRPWADVVVIDPRARLAIDLGDRLLHVHARNGHTASDLVVEDPDARLLFSGDLVWNGMFPNYTDAQPLTLRESVRWLGSRDARALVPGHGARADAPAFDRSVALLDSLEHVARRAVADGVPVDEAARRYVVPEALGDWMASPTGVRRAMAAWYRALGSSTA
jgi:glyoxylase-like metal-dependent hydrolase (beta-lactamase superfamily II)